MENNRHHCIARSREKEGFDVNNKRNIIEINANLHKGIHKLFENKTPQEQIELMYRLNREVIGWETRELIEEIIHMDDFDFYDERILK